MKGFFEEEQSALKEKFDHVLEGATELRDMAWEELSGSLDEVKEEIDQLDRDIGEGLVDAMDQAMEYIPTIKEFLSTHNKIVSNYISLFGLNPQGITPPERILEKIDELFADLDPYSSSPEDIQRDLSNLKYVIDELYRPVVEMAMNAWRDRNEASLRLLLSATELAFKKRDRFRRELVNRKRR